MMQFFIVAADSLQKIPPPFPPTPNELSAALS